MQKEYQATFAVAVMAKVRNAESIQSITSWTTQDHLSTLAKLIAQKVGGDAAVVGDILKDCYNISAFQQSLAKLEQFKSKGHFQRNAASPTLDTLVASLEEAKQG